jgi:hypothetical protein
MDVNPYSNRCQSTSGHSEFADGTQASSQPASRVSASFSFHCYMFDGYQVIFDGVSRRYARQSLGATVLLESAHLTSVRIFDGSGCLSGPDIRRVRLSITRSENQVVDVWRIGSPRRHDLPRERESTAYGNPQRRQAI